MNQHQRQLLEHHSSRIVAELNDAFIHLLTRQLIDLKAQGVSANERRQIEHICIAWYYETESKVLKWLHREALRSANLDECSVRIRSEALADLRQTMSDDGGRVTWPK